jgi:hypothetical protein
MPWLRGNLHCHSTRSDGDSPPDTVARHYRDAGFDFVAITDHNQRTAREHCGDLGDGFIVLPGCEYSFSHRGVNTHVNGIGVREPLRPPERACASVAEALQAGIDQARAQDAFAMVNHPNWLWSFGAEVLGRLHGAHAFELWNGGWTCNSLGDATHPSTETMWDGLLSEGRRLWGVASDDCHRFAPPRRPEDDPPHSGWVAVDASERSADAIISALKDGRFCATTGLAPVVCSLQREEVEVVVEHPSRDAVGYRLEAIGRGGRLLGASDGPSLHYRPRGDEGYVRVRASCSTGQRLWTQPLFLD